MTCSCLREGNVGVDTDGDVHGYVNGDDDVIEKSRSEAAVGGEDFLDTVCTSPVA